MAEGLVVEVGLTEAQYRRALTRIEANTIRTARRAEQSFARVNKSTGTWAKGGLRQVSQQLSQVAQQGSATGNYLQALAIQLPDIGLAFGTAGIAAGVFAGALLPLLTNMGSVGDRSAELRKAIDALADSLGDLEKAQSSFDDASLGSLAEKYGTAAVRARELLAIQRDLAYLDSAKALSGAVEEISDQFGVLKFSTDEAFKNVAEDLERLYDAVNGINPEAVQELADVLKITEEEAQLLAEQFAELEQARGPEAQAAALRNVIEQIELATGGVWEMDEGTREVYEKLLLSEQAANRLAAIDVASGIWEGADAASALADQLNRAAAAEAALATATDGGPDAARRAVMDGSAQREYFERFTLPETLKTTPVARTRRGGGGGGGGGSRGLSEQQREAKQLFDQTRTAAEKYEAELAKIQALHEGGFITDDTYARSLDMIAEKYGEAGDAAEGFGSITETLKDAIIDMAMGSETALDSLADAIKRAALEAVLFGEGPLGGLFGGGAGLLGGLFKSFTGGLPSRDGGGYTWDGPRSGGLDGRGGRLALLHPNETVLDHARGQGMGASITYAPVIDARGADQAAVARLAGVVAEDRKMFAANVQRVMQNTGLRGR